MRAHWRALAALGLAALMCALSNPRAIKGHPTLYRGLVVAYPVLVAILVVAFARGAALLARAPGRVALRAILLQAPLSLFVAFHLLVQNWVVNTWYTLLILFYSSYGPQLNR